MKTRNYPSPNKSIDLMEAIKKRRELILKYPNLHVWRQPCEVSLLIVTDGDLDFSYGDFGLSTFVHVLQNTGRAFVRFHITLAHLSNTVSDHLELTVNEQILTNEEIALAENLLIDRDRITRHIKGFCFDNPDHFSPDKYDEVWLFGFESDYHSGSNYVTRQSERNRYPAHRLGDEELKNLSKHMDRGGGLFATGDHGAIGLGLGGSVKRVRSMRLWPDVDLVDVGMQNENRNDTNQPSIDPDYFSDQCDDIPQPLDLKLYSSWAAEMLVVRYPHPLMCSRYGRIDVFPDHPHEGECKMPANINAIYELDQTHEYPLTGDGQTRPLPEIIAYSRVLAGLTSGYKDPTKAQTFGAISVYDGHPINLGRVVCDSTWHHFVNFNLIGIEENTLNGGLLNFPGTDPNKHTGFLATAEGRDTLAKICEYYINTAVWMAPPMSQNCFLKGGLSIITYKHHVVEATVMDPNIKFDQIKLKEFRYIGIHARDVLGNMVSRCQTLHWVIIWLTDIWPEFAELIDPWLADYKRSKNELLFPTFELMPILDIALGGALVAMRQSIPYPSGVFTSNHQKKLDEAANKGAKQALSKAVKYLEGNINTLKKLFDSFK